MSTNLKEELRQKRPFASTEQEAFLSLGRTWAVLEHAFSEALKPHEITPTQYNALRILRGAGPEGLSRGDIVHRMVSRVPDATRLLDRLEAMGLSVRARDTQDRRYVRTRITEQGLALLADLDDSVQELHERHLGALGEDDLETLIDLLSRIRSSI
ncbi:MAG: MarR family transcriptional regulator [Gemmatimonadota bacterium]